MPNNFSRRTFLAAASAAAATALVAKSAFAQGSDAPKKLGYAFVGIGSLTMNQILPAVVKSKLVKAVALVSGHPDKARAQADKYGIDAKNIYNYENYDTIKNNPDIDVVYVVLPNGMHAEYTIRAAQAGKHVLCEKPMANTVEECQAMIDACKTAKRKLLIAYRMQLEPMTLNAIALAHSPDIGVIKTIMGEAGFNASRNTPETWWRANKKLAGGGPLMDMGIYPLQAARYLTGEEPTSVAAISYATPNVPAFREIEETINLQLTFPSGVVASILTTYAFGCNRVRLYGSNGQLDMEPFQGYSGNHLWVTRGRAARQEVTYTPVDHFATEMDYLCACIQADKQPKIAGEEGLKDMKVMMAAYEAARTGKMVKLG